MTEEETRIDLSGTEITINGERHAVESGEMVARFYNDQDIHGQPFGSTRTEISTDVDLMDAEDLHGDGWSPEDGAGYIPTEEGGALRRDVIAQDDTNPAVTVTNAPLSDGRVYLARRRETLGVTDRLETVCQTPSEAFAAIVNHARDSFPGDEPEWPESFGEDVWAWRTDHGATYTITELVWSGAVDEYAEDNNA